MLLNQYTEDYIDQTIPSNVNYTSGMLEKFKYFKEKQKRLRVLV